MLPKAITQKLPLSWKRYIKFTLKPNSFHLLPKERTRYSSDFFYTFTNAGFINDPKFENAYKWAEKLKTQLWGKVNMQWQIHLLCWAAEQVKHLPGDFVTCGVFSGFCDRAIMEYIDFKKLDKTYYLMDTFEGMDPKYSSSYEFKAYGRYKEFPGMYEQVKETFRDFNVKVIKGSVPETLPLATTDQICFLSIDMNAVVPEVAALEYFWPKIVSGGVIVLDDYGLQKHEAQKEGHDAFAKSVGHSIFSSPTGQGIIFKK